MKRFFTSILAIIGLGATPSESREMFEASAGFDSDIVQPFLERLNSKLGLDLDVSALVVFTESVAHDDEQATKLVVPFQSKRINLEYHVFKDDPYAPDLYFFSTSKDLINAISQEFDLFFEEQGM